MELITVLPTVQQSDSKYSGSLTTSWHGHTTGGKLAIFQGIERLLRSSLKDLVVRWELSKSLNVIPEGSWGCDGRITRMRQSDNISIPYSSCSPQFWEDRT